MKFFTAVITVIVSDPVGPIRRQTQPLFSSSDQICSDTQLHWRHWESEGAGRRQIIIMNNKKSDDQGWQVAELLFRPDGLLSG